MLRGRSAIGDSCRYGGNAVTNRRLAVLAQILGLLALGAAMWLLWRIPNRLPPVAIATASPTQAVEIALPTRPPTATTLPTSTRPPTVSPSPTASLVPTSTPTATLTPTPTPTATPLHGPATGDPSRLQAPAAGLDLPLSPVEPDESHRLPPETLVEAIYHLGSSRPGHPGNVIISGPADVTNPLLQPLQQLTPGDRLYVWVGVVPYRYVISAVWRDSELDGEAETPDQSAWFAQTDDQWLTVIAGWPCEATTGCTVLRAVPAAWEGDAN